MVIVWEGEISRDAETAKEVGRALGKECGRLLVASVVLVFVHLLNISPTEVEAFGAKITLKDPILLRGSIAILFLHWFHSSVLTARQFYAVGGSTGERLLMRRSLSRYAKGRTIRGKKFRTKLDTALWNIAFAPYLLAVGLFVISALFLSLVDLWRFGTFCLDHSQAINYIDSLLSD